MHSRIIALTLATATFTHCGLSGQFDWPQWQGPDRTAHSKETGLLKEWPKDGPPLAWQAKGLGGGDSTLSIAAERIYGMSYRGSDEMVWALSEKDGKEIWAVRIEPEVSGHFNVLPHVEVELATTHLLDHQSGRRWSRVVSNEVRCTDARTP